jgi:hypothetical protein
VNSIAAGIARPVPMSAAVPWPPEVPREAAGLIEFGRLGADLQDAPVRCPQFPGCVAGGERNQVQGR